MSTKADPGPYGCYAQADAEEQIFHLLGRDRMAPSLVELWALARESTGEESSVVLNARDTASFMRNDLYLRQRREIRVLDVVPLAYLEAVIARRRADEERLRVAALPIVVESGFGGLNPLEHVNGHESQGTLSSHSEGGEPT